MSIFLCEKSTEQEVGLLSQYQTQKHGILSFSRKPIGSWIEIHISIESSLFDQLCKYGRFDIFDVLALTDAVSLHCFFASFEERKPFIPKEKECLFSTQILIPNQNPENVSNNIQEKLVPKISIEDLSEKEISRQEGHLAIIWQDILDCCETFRGEYGFVIPFVLLHSIEENTSKMNECNRLRDLNLGNSSIRDSYVNSSCYYTLHCFNYTDGFWKIKTHPLALVSQEMNFCIDIPESA